MRETEGIDRFGLKVAGRDLVPFDEKDEEAIAVCMNWIGKNAVQMKVGYWRKRGSYGFKHDVEREVRPETERTGKGVHWVGNGHFIEAARRLGYKFRRCSDDLKDPNAYFNFKIPKSYYQTVVNRWPRYWAVFPYSFSEPETSREFR